MIEIRTRWRLRNETNEKEIWNSSVLNFYWMMNCIWIRWEENRKSSYEWNQNQTKHEFCPKQRSKFKRNNSKIQMKITWNSNGIMIEIPIKRECDFELNENWNLKEAWSLLLWNQNRKMKWTRIIIWVKWRLISKSNE